MISTISQNTSFITVSVGHEVRVRDSQKAGDVESFRVKKEKDSERKEPTELEESQHSKPGPTTWPLPLAFLLQQGQSLLR